MNESDFKSIMSDKVGQTLEKERQVQSLVIYGN